MCKLLWLRSLLNEIGYTPSDEINLYCDNRAAIQIAQNEKLSIHDHDILIDKEQYQRLVGKLIYLSHTQPDIAYTVSLVSQFMHNPSKDHLSVVIQILRYLKSSPGRGLMLRKHGHLNMEGHSDAN